MTRDRNSAVSGMTVRQKATIGIFLVIVLVLLWQVYGLFKTEEAPPPAPKTQMAVSTASPMGMTPQDSTPQTAPVPRLQNQPLTPQEAELQRVQQQTEARYVSAINELQMLRVEKDIAETNKAIMSARLEAVTAEKGIVQLLQPPPPPVTSQTYAQGLVNPIPKTPQQAAGQNQEGPPQQAITPPPVTETPYTVISVSFVQDKWNAILGNQGNLYSVMIGDILPPDGSTVVSIGRTGIVLEKNGAKRKISLVPII